jgi:hypothetical protein
VLKIPPISIVSYPDGPARINSLFDSTNYALLGHVETDQAGRERCFPIILSRFRAEDRKAYAEPPQKIAEKSIPSQSFSSEAFIRDF